MPQTPLILLEGASLVRDGARVVFRDMTLAVQAGERIGLVGPNGVGKTSLLHVLVGLLRPSTGTLTMFGQPRRQEGDFTEVRRRVGLLFQDSDDQLFCPTVAEDVAFGPMNLGATRAEAQAVAERTLTRLGMAGFGDRVTYRLSGGEKRMVALATVLAMDPEVLLLDEPTTGLDEAAETRMLDLLMTLDQAMVIVSHDRRVIDRLATRVVRMDPPASATARPPAAKARLVDAPAAKARAAE